MPDSSTDIGNALRSQLLSDGVLKDSSAVLTPIVGGVSSYIYVVDDGDHRFVVKQARPKLAVRDEWYADPVRNYYEQLYMRYVKKFLPSAVPTVEYSGDGYFTMEYLGCNFANWKTLLIEGNVSREHAEVAGTTLGMIHKHSQGDANVAGEFDTTDNFHLLRTDPHLLTIARRHPEIRDVVEKEATRLDSTQECLVHGDFSPKNILFDGPRFVLVDCEVAWFGDPAFDLAYLAHHLLLKSLYHSPRELGIRELVEGFFAAYYKACGTEEELSAERDIRAARLTIMLLLARIDGKSPVDYLDEPSQEHVRSFVHRLLLDDFGGSTPEMLELWFESLQLKTVYC